MYRERYFYYRMNFLPIENTSFLSYSRYFIPPQYWHRFCISIVTRIGAFYFSKCVSYRLITSHGISRLYPQCHFLFSHCVSRLYLQCQMDVIKDLPKKVCSRKTVQK